MAILGTKKKPAILRAQSMERAEELAGICHEHGWHFILGIEPDKSEDISHLETLLHQEKSGKTGPRAERNDPCPCGSGVKYKKCCMVRDLYGV